jgi:copper homeostasis protein
MMKMTKKILEVCVFSLEAALKAERSGADRLELCSNPMEGGTTPHPALVKAACRKCNIPVYPIIRPRGGGFCYSEDEFEMMKEDILFCKEAGCKGIATGVLLPDNRVDVNRMKQLVELAHPMGVTFIRAFDLTPDPFEALEDVIEAGCERILTSGQKDKVTDAPELIEQLVRKAASRISIMPGSGVRADNIRQIMDATNACEIHSSARVFLPNDSEMADNLGFGQAVSCDENQIQKMRKEIN